MAAPLKLLAFLIITLIPNLSYCRPASKTQQNSKKQTHQNPSPNCSGRMIYIFPLPSRFNADLLSNCNSSSYPLFSSASFCPHLSNHGLGLRTHNRSRSWFRTDPLFFELLFHRRLLEYSCLTSNPSSASAIFLPYYTSLDALPYLYSPDTYNNSNLHGLDLYNHIKSSYLWNKNHSYDIFLVSARPAWDMSQDPAADPPVWGTSFLQIPEFLNVTVLTVESRAWPWQEVGIPYPTSFHPATLGRLDAWIARARSSRRSNLMVFVGGGGSGGPNIRGSIKAECENRTDLCEVVDCSDGICTHDPIRFMKPMLRSDFCLQPPGDNPTRRSTFDSILAGCIPVFFEEISAKMQYGWHLPKKDYDEFSVFVPKEDVVFNGVRIVDVLEAIPRGQVRRMREKVLELAPRVMYRRHGSSDGLREKKDAFDIAIDGVLRRIKRRVAAVLKSEDIYADDEENDVE